MISVRNLSKHFGTRAAVRGVSFEVRPGEVLGFLGPNGAGKTTTMRMITGFLAPSGGEAWVNGYPVAEKPVEARRGLGYLPENAPSYPDMTVEEFLDFTAEIRGFHGAEKKDRVAAALAKCILLPVRGQAIETLSKGYRQRTCFAQAILHDPSVLILDEPTEGLDPNQKHVVRTMIKDMARDKAIVLSTHILEEVEAICTRIVIISGGRLVADSTPAELRRQGTLDEVFRRLTTTADTQPAGRSA
jgi:ABC-2 type transport system ATP-binding protein